MKKGINSEYDSLRRELFELRSQLITNPNVNKEEVNRRISIIVNRLAELEFEYQKGGKEK